MIYTRNRAKGTFAIAGVMNDLGLWGNCTMSSTTVTLSRNMMQVGESYTMSDVIVPKFYRRRAKGEVFFNPMSSVHKLATRTGGTGNHRVATTSTITCGGIPRIKELDNSDSLADFAYMGLHSLSPGAYIGPETLISGVDISSLMNEVSTRSLGGVALPSNDILEDVAEFNQSLRILPDLITNVRKFVSKPSNGKLIREFKRFSEDPQGINFKEILSRKNLAKHIARRNLDISADTYLTWRYGIRPLLEDISGVIEGLHKSTGPMRASSRAHGQLSQNKSVIETDSYSTGIETYTKSITDDVSIRAVSLYEMNASKAFNVGISLKGLLSLPLELTPYSFVVDWFVNLSDYLHAVLPTPGINQLGSCVVLQRDSNMTYQTLSSTSKTGWNCVTPASGGFSTYIGTKQRIPGIAGPRLTIKSDFRFDHITRSLDAASLLLQKLKHF